MSKSRKYSKKSISLKKIKKSTLKALPVVNKGLEQIGTTAKDAAIKSKPYVEKGVSVVYDSLAKGFDLGIQGAKSVANQIRRSKNKTKKSNRRRGSNRR
jgi:hypothetical protein